MQLACAASSVNFANFSKAMKHFLTLAILAFFTSSIVQAQTLDLVMFADDGAKFTLIVDGDEKNAEPAARVVATGLKNETSIVMIRFAEASIPQMRKTLYLTLGQEYTVMITTNKKGERVLRQTGEAALGTAKPEVVAKPSAATFVEDKPAVAPSTNVVEQEVVVGGVHQVTTVTVVEENGKGDSTGEDISISMGMPGGVGFDVKVRVDEKGMDTRSTETKGGTTTRTTTTTTTTSTPKPAVTRAAIEVAPAPVKEPEVYRMPGYTGPVGCGMPMSATEFAEAKKSIESKNFEDTKMTMAKQVGRDRCFTAEQVKTIMGVFSFEDSKLDFARYAYDRTHDIGNYYKLNDAFTFESSVDDLNEYLQTR